MYEHLDPGTVRRTFTDSNLTLIDTDADRFMKVANGVPTPPGASVPIAPANPTPAAPAGIAASAASLGTLVAETPEPTTISTFVPQGLYPRKAIASKSRRATRGRVADRDASARHGSIRVDVGLGEATHPTAAVRPDLIDLALAQIGTESTPAHGNRARRDWSRPRRQPAPTTPRSLAIDRPDGPFDLGLIYDDDAYVELEARRAPSADGRPSGLMGRQVAGRSFLAALLGHGTWTDLAILARHHGAEDSLVRAFRDNPSGRPRRLDLLDEARLLDDPAAPPRPACSTCLPPSTRDTRGRDRRQVPGHSRCRA